MVEEQRGTFSIGAAFVNFDRQCIEVADEQHRLPAKPMDLLYLLVQEAGQTVSRDSIIERVWDGNGYVGKRAINDAVWRLRKAFQDPPDQAIYIETIPKLGYRLVQPVKPVQASPERPSRGGLTLTRIILSMAVLSMVAFALREAIIRQKAIPPAPVLKPLTVQPITMESGIEHDAAISNDGQLLAYTHLVPNAFSRIFIRPLKGQAMSPRALDSQPGWQRFPTWSHDGQQVAYVNIHAGQAEVVVVNRKTGHRRIFESLGLIPSRRIEFSPVANLIAFSATQAGSNSAGICLLDIDQSTTQFVTSQPTSRHLVDHNVHWSPDGQQLSFSRPAGMGADIFIVNLDGTTRQVTFDGVKTWGSDWEPDGQSLIVSTSRGSGMQDGGMLWRFGLRNQRATLLGGTHQNLFFPECSPDERSLHAYVTDAHVRSYSMVLKPKAALESMAGSSENDADCDYSPANQRLVFSSTRDGHKELWTCALDGSDLRQLTRLRRDAAFPKWSPGGQQIVFIAYNPSKTLRTTYLLNWANGKIQPLGSELDFLICPSWARNGKSMYAVKYEDGQFNLWRFPIDGRQGQPVLSQNGFYAQESWDGTTVYYTKDNAGGLFSKPVGGGPETVVIPWQGASGLTWLVLENQIVFVSNDPSGAKILAYDLSSKQTTTVNELDRGFVPAPRPWSYVPERQALLLSRNHEDQGAIARVEWGPTI